MKYNCNLILNYLFLFILVACNFASKEERLISRKSFFQPNGKEVAFISKVIENSDTKQSNIFFEGVPFSKYWQMDKETKFVFHPMLFGEHLLRNADKFKNLNEVNSLITKTASILPNGGIGFYYPNHYPLSRMNGSEIMMSAISQSTILSGLIKINQKFPGTESNALLKKVLKGLFFKWDQGGVDLNGFAQLEMPLFSSNPEIILNGWLHSLFILNDYAIIYNDKYVREYIENNLNFLSSNHSVWYDEDRKISRYSDTTPLRIRLAFNGKLSEEDIRIVYRPLVSQMPLVEVDPETLFRNTKISGYGTGIISKNKNSFLIAVNCSQLYDTELWLKNKFTISYHKGIYDPLRSTPLAGELVTAESIKSDKWYKYIIKPSNKNLLCGYPTNFSKAKSKTAQIKKNFYHMQHIVAMLYLANNPSYENKSLNKNLIAIAKKWYENNAKFEEKKVGDFESPQKVLDTINRGKVLQQETSASKLFQKSGIAIFEDHL